MADPEIRIKVKADADEARRTFGDFARQIPGVGAAIDLLKNPLVGVIALLTSAALAVRSFFKEFAQSEEQFARLDAALAQSGQLTDQYRESLAELAGQLQETTGIADDKWLETLRKLTQFGATEGNINQAAEAVKNLAGIMDGDLTGAANLVGRALQGNFEVLGRYGIKAKDLTSLFRELAEKGAGQLEARTKTLTGAWEKFENVVSDIKESLGGVLDQQGAFRGALELVTNALGYYLDKLSSTPKVLDGLKNASKKTTEEMKAGEDATRRYAAEMGELQTKISGVNKGLDERKKLIDSQKDEQLQLLEAERERDLAKINASTASDADKAEARFRVQERFVAGKEGIETAAIGEEVRSAQQAAVAAAAAKAATEQRIKELEARAVEDQEIEDLQAKLKTASAELAAAKSLLKEGAERGIGFNPIAGQLKLEHPSDVTVTQELESRFRLAELRRAALPAQIARMEAELGGRVSVRDQTVEQISNLRGQLPEIDKLADERAADLRAAEERAVRRADFHSQLNSIQREARGFNRLGELRGEASGLQTTIAGRVQAEASQRGVSAARVEASYNHNEDAMVRTLERVLQRMSGLEQKLNAVESRYSKGPR